MLAPAFESFVGGIPAPFVYGLTPAETAVWLKRVLALEVDLQVAPMQGYRREAGRGADWPAFVPPSPAIRTWPVAICYPATVPLEALPVLDHGRQTATPFQVFGAPDLDTARMTQQLTEMRLPGVEFQPCAYTAGTGAYAGRTVKGVRLTVDHPDRFRPARTAMGVILAAQQVLGVRGVWEFPGTRKEFFDQLMGTDQVRLALQAGAPLADIAAAWENESGAYREARAACRIYPEPSSGSTDIS